ncbi:MAG: hypothetical protein IT320_18940 [Anaerolineae bacterium]|nr:hypothetical protein [Anaerolineae bacterium]
MILIFLPVVPFIIIIPLLLETITGNIYVDRSNLATAVFAELVLVICYLLNRAGRFSIARWFFFVTITMVIVANAVNTSQPHLEILYLLAVPTMGLFLLSRREMLWLSVALTVIMVWFAFSHYEDLGTSTTDLVSVVVINSLLLLTVSVYRDRLEASRSRVLVEKETQLQLMLDNLPAIVWRLDRDLAPLSSAGGPRDADMREQIVASLVNEETYRAALKVVLAGISVDFEHMSHGVPCRSYAEPMYDTTGEIIGCSGITIDISTQKQEEARREAAIAEHERMRVLEDFLESASHDLRTPLTEMNMSVELLRRAPDPERRDYHGERLNQSIRRLGHILDMMFTMVRLDVLTPEQGEPLDLNYVVRYVSDETLEFAEAHKIKLNRELASNLDTISSYSEDALRTAIDQVLQNALQNTPEDGSVTLRTVRQGERICLEVIDTGVGIPADELERVFDRFYRVEKHRPLDEVHVGLGLAIAKRVVELHNGEIRIESEVGQGTRVILCFPLAPAA